MIKITKDIADNEIRIITANESKLPKKKNLFIRVFLPAIAVVVLLATICWIFLPESDDSVDEPMPQVQEQPAVNQATIEAAELSAPAKGSVTVIDTTINKCRLLIIYPENLRPRLVMGCGGLNDSTIMLATQAADIRRDNGEIAGTFVMQGQLISKGEAKAGFCSIINDEISIGVSDATPVLEQSLMHDGYFFRQYPLVVGGQIVENKPKGKAIRKALADIDGKICVIMSKDKLTFHDFSQLLVDAGVRNGVYLVGSMSYGFYRDASGQKISTGVSAKKEAENTNYIVWQQP